MTKPKRLLRSNNRIIAGVCAGIAEYLNIDPTVVRVIWAILSLCSLGVGIIAYIICWIIMPEK
ncbi:PspC domain-containing protein [Candidatus Woesearchaeota archaeon]|nr:PspC domain-containing protein [Candidatus Woesearchaeota archaeon]